MKPTFATALLLATFAVACASAPPRAPAPAARAALADEAATFMAGYAAELRAGAVDRILARYDPRGAYFVGSGSKRLVSPDSIAAQYHSGWQRPASFDWRDLSYEVVGPDAVVVTGLFEWGTGTGQPLRFSYTSLLLRKPDGLRIRVEDESGAPR
jgi:hypothetical protein